MTSLATDYSNFVQSDQQGRHRIFLTVEGMSCPACAFKIERALNNNDVEARVNVTERRMMLSWSGDSSAGGKLIEKASSLGFRFSPIQKNSETSPYSPAVLLKYIAVAGFGAGNIMIFSLALWFSTRSTMGDSTRDLMHWYSALIALPVVIYAGRPFFTSAWNALRKQSTNMDVPISVGVSLACGVSLFETITGGEHVYFDSAVMLLFLLLIGRYFDAKLRARAKSAASDLLALMSGIATQVQDSKISRIPAAAIKPGMTLMVARGEKILADGICENDTIVDASAITGETLPKNISMGEYVFSGMINLSDPITVRIEKSQNDSLMGDIITLMQKAEQGNARYVRIADRLARWYTPAVHALAFATFLFWAFATNVGWQTAALYAITVLIITCPCALGLAVPVTQVVAASKLFKSGMLLKSSDALERLAMIDTVVFDKTGTLTTGEMVFENAEDFTADEKEALASLASASRHPLARALTIALGEQSLLAFTPREIEGKGMEFLADGQRYALGSAAFIGAQSGSDEKTELWFTNGTDKKRLTFSDKLQHDACEVIDALNKRYSVIMLSGDRSAVAKRTAEELRIPSWQGEITPREKLEFIQDMAAHKKNVLMVGDGLNDAAALSCAKASMSPASALDIAQNAADIVYQRPGIGSVMEAIKTAKKTQKIVRQNLSFSIAYNLLAVPIALTGNATPLIAAAAMATSSLIVVANSLRAGKD